MAKKDKKNLDEVSKNEINEAKAALAGIIEGKQTKIELNDKLISVFRLTLKILESYLLLVSILQKKNISLRNLKRLLFGNKSEKTDKIQKDPGELGTGGESGGNNDGSGVSGGGTTPGNKIGKENSKNHGKGSLNNSPNKEEENKLIKKKRKGGGGRNGHEAYTGATEIHCPLCPEMRPGHICPSCGRHKLYQIPPITTVRLIGSAPIQAFKFLEERSGCICGVTFTGRAPDPYTEIQQGPKFSSSSLSTIIHQKFDLGVPFGSLSSFQKTVGVPLPATTQANKVKLCLAPLLAVYGVLEAQGANMDLIGFDDTNIKILEGKITKEGTKSIHGYGSVFVCNNINQKKIIVLYCFDFDHAGKYLFKLLQLRDKELPLLMALCDGLKAYEPYMEDNTLPNKCNIHSRRHFFQYDLKGEDYFCSLIISGYKKIYENEKNCRENNLSPKARQEFHAINSLTPLETIKNVCQFITAPPSSPSLNKLRTELKIPDFAIPSEPNSDLYKHAIYTLVRWEELTNFTRIPGIPLDTNYVERKIKAIIEIRIRGLFFKTILSAGEAGKVLSLIETAKENGHNSVDYIQFLIDQEEEVLKAPEDFLPWNYQAHRLYGVRRPLSIHPENRPRPGLPA